MKKSALLLCLTLVLVHVSHAKDFGLIIDQSAGYGGMGNDASADYTGALIPRFSTPLGGVGDLYISAGFLVDYEKDIIRFVPELLRTELSLLFSFGEFKAGRMYYADPLGFIANGLFDGARFSLYTGAGTFSAGAWYTGFLYKRRANIAMTPEEQAAYVLEPDYKDFINSYFAPRRLAAAVEWEHFSLGGPLQTRLALLGQFDLGGQLHSEYAVAKITLPLGVITFDLGGCMELAQNDEDMETAAAAELGIHAALPTSVQDTLSLRALYSSGKGKLAAFLPLTTLEQGEIFEVKLSGISLVSLDYTARLHPAFSAGISSTYFIRSDLKTYTAYPLTTNPVTEDSGRYLLGNEFFARLMWNPFSDLQINLGGGVFLPSLGNAAPKAAPLWRVELNVVFGL